MITWLRRGYGAQERYRLLVFAAVPAAVALSALLGSRATPALVAAVAAAVVAVPAFSLLTRAPAWGLLALVPVAFLVPFAVGTGTVVSLNAPFLMVPVLVVAWIVRMIVIDREVKLARSRVNLPAVLFAVATTLALITGGVRWIPIADGASLQSQLGGWGLYVFSIALFMLAANQLRDERWLQALTWAFLALGAVYVAGRLASRLIPSLAFIKSLFVSGSVDSAFWTWLVALAFGQCLLNRDLRLHWRVLLGAVTVAALSVALSEVSRSWISGWLPPLLALYAITWLRSWRWGLVATVIAAAVLIPQLSAISAVTFDTPEQTFSTGVRLAIWTNMLQMMQKSPILGLGLANYHFYAHLYPVWGYTLNFNSHNNYVDIMAQTGLVGLASFAWLALAIGWVGWRLRRRALDGFGRAYVCAALGGFVATLASGIAGDWFLPFAYNVGITGFRSSMFVWLFLGGLVAIEHILNGRDGPGGR